MPTLVGLIFATLHRMERRRSSRKVAAQRRNAHRLRPGTVAHHVDYIGRYAVSATPITARGRGNTGSVRG